MNSGGSARPTKGAHAFTTQALGAGERRAGTKRQHLVSGEPTEGDPRSPLPPPPASGPLTVLTMNLLGDWLRDYLDPTMRNV